MLKLIELIDLHLMNHVCLIQIYFVCDFQINAVQSSSTLTGKMVLYTDCVRETCASAQKVLSATNNS